jgi:hypothetical protein
MHDGKVIAIRHADPAKSLLNKRQNAVLGLATGEQSGFVPEADDGLQPGQRTPFGLLAMFRDASDVKALGISDSFHSTAIYQKVAGLVPARGFRKLGPGGDRLNDGCQ